jgi:hypothetical protein
MPAVNTCMGCHTIVAAQRPEIQKLAKYYNEKRPIPWVHIHKVPEYVHFPHVRHYADKDHCQKRIHRAHRQEIAFHLHGRPRRLRGRGAGDAAGAQEAVLGRESQLLGLDHRSARRAAPVER